MPKRIQKYEEGHENTTPEKGPRAVLNQIGYSLDRFMQLVSFLCQCGCRIV